MQINEEKRKKFMEYAGKRVNNVLHDIQILEPMSRSTSYDFTKEDVAEMFNAMQETLNNTRAEFERKFEEKARAEKKTFSFGSTTTTPAYTYSSEETTNIIETPISEIETLNSSETISSVETTI